MQNNFKEVTETPDVLISQRQLKRMTDRYSWTSIQTERKDVLEVACGIGQGLGLIAQRARSVKACDISKELSKCASEHYKGRIEILCADAENLPYQDNSFDCVIMHEALYYISNLELFMSEAKRVLRKGGALLITSANKDFPAFHKSKYSTTYLGAVGLAELLEGHGFNVSLWGYESVVEDRVLEKALHFAKATLLSLGIFPQSMSAKAFFRRLVQGKMVKMPSELIETSDDIRLKEIGSSEPCKSYKTIFCVGTLNR